MATANPVVLSKSEDNFELELKRVRENVRRYFLNYFNV